MLDAAVLYEETVMGCERVELPEPEGNRFTVCPATTYGITSQTKLAKTILNLYIEDILAKLSLQY